MNKEKFEKYCQELQGDIQTSYEAGTSLEDAERLAAKFLDASIRVGEAYKHADLDRRMRKAGLKAVKAAVYLEHASKGDKKPSDKLLEAIVDSDGLVKGEQKLFDEADVYAASLSNYLSVFHEAHIYYRGITKGKFE